MKKSMFFENAKMLYDELGISPLMYGSLGLEYITNQALNADDIDILIPETFLTDKWNNFKNVLEVKGYLLTDQHEHTFEKDGVCYSYASIEELEIFANIKMCDIKEQNDNGVKFKLLSLEQYLKVYTASSKDGYRINVRQKKDNDKIAFIKKLL